MPAWSQRASRTATVLALAAFAGAVQLGLLALAERALGAPSAWVAGGLASAVLAGLLGVLDPVRRRLERVLAVDHVRAIDGVDRAIRELARVRDEVGVIAIVRGALQDALGTSDVRVVDAAEAAPDTALFVPFGGSDHLAGGLALGARASGRPDSRGDRALVATLAAQAAVAIANARVWDEVRALESRAREENAYLRDAVLPAGDDGELVGESLALRSVLAQVSQVAPTDAPVIVLGETGTGKELVVRRIHQRSRRAERPLVQVASAAIPESLLESELFGHEKGAFTGATARKAGRFEVADGGTLFLDDVDTLPLAIQAKLLRAIQEGEVQRLGSNQVRLVDVRIVAASNRDLLGEVRAGRFREDLYYRLHVVPIRLPPLRERLEDVPLLVRRFVVTESARLRRPAPEVPDATLFALQQHDWPGNVRELRNVIERAVVLCNDGVLTLPEPLGASAARGADPSSDAGDLGKASLAELMKRYKTRLIRAALERSDGNQRRAAELLGIQRPSLSRMLREIDAPAQRS
jgi:transcriptional regulator with GAF, ATPase, and Fis domain